MEYCMDLSRFEEKEIYSLSDTFYGKGLGEQNLSFTNYYMEMNGDPFFGISGEFHFSRMEACRWEDEIIKMKMCGINTISTYIFWNHHEETEGIFEFEGRRNLKQFVELCAKHQLYVIIRIGPFNHGEARNGGLPDWLYGKSFEVRELNEGFLYYTRRLYEAIAKQVKGLFYWEGGPIIAAQIDNEYMHSSAPWEGTTGVSNEWISVGTGGETYLLALKEEAVKSGIITPFYTCTAWGGAATPDSMMPLWGGYAFRPWLFYSGTGKHPSTQEYIYQDFHNNQIPPFLDFEPKYQPQDRPYACCEMGGGMTCSYHYRFVLPYKSVDAMANIKLASGCNFLGYYVFQGGSNPKGKYGGFLNESQVPKISYDYQAPLGEFGQIRESYRRLKAIHSFCRMFEKTLCKMKTVLPKGASLIQPSDLTTLRYAVRTDGHSGFLFLNNYQDHERTRAKEKEQVKICLTKETILFDKLGLAPDENCILPFHMDVEGIDLVYATAQPMTKIQWDGKWTYVFIKPEGMESRFCFEEQAHVNQAGNLYICLDSMEEELFTVVKGEKEVHILCMKRELANQLFVVKGEALVFTEGALLAEDNKLRLETESSHPILRTYPWNYFQGVQELKKIEACNETNMGKWIIRGEEVCIEPQIEQVGPNRYIIYFPRHFMRGLKELLLQIRYQGDLGQAFLDGELIHDNFCNGETWEMGLKTLVGRLDQQPITIVITPKNGVGTIENVKTCPVYEYVIA